MFAKDLNQPNSNDGRQPNDQGEVAGNRAPGAVFDNLVKPDDALVRSLARSEVLVGSPAAREAAGEALTEPSVEVKPAVVVKQKSARVDHDESALSTFLTRSFATLKSLSTSFGATLCYSLTGVCSQAARGPAVDVAHYPNPLLYCGFRSLVASAASYFKDRKTLHEVGVTGSLAEMGREGRTMVLLMGVNNVLWVPAFMMTDLASALVIGCSQPFIHAIYDRVTTRKADPHREKKDSPHSWTEVASLSLTGAALASIALNTASTPSAYPHALFGNLAAAAATACFCAYMIINNQVVTRAKEQAGADSQAQEKAKREASARLRTVPFFAQVSSAILGFGLFIPFQSGALLSGGLGLNPWNTLAIAAAHGTLTAAALYLRTAATQTNKPVVVSLLSNLQVGLTPTLGFLLLGSTVPQFAVVGGILSFGASMVTVAGEYMKQKNPGQKPETK